MSRRAPSWIVAVLFAGGVLFPGCVLGDVELEGRPCPCATGWTCDEAENVCVRSDGRDGGTRDGGTRDAGPRDGGPDSDIEDAGTARDGGPDGSAEDGGPEDAGTDAGVDTGPPPDVLFEEDFERGDFTRWSYRNETNGAVTNVNDAASARRGARYLRARSTSAGGSGALGFRMGAPYSSGDLWVRTYVRVPSASNLDRGATFAAFGISMPPWDSASFQLEARAVSTYVSTTPRYDEGTESLDRDRWHCVVGHVVVGDAPAGSIDVFVDGVAAVRSIGLDTLSIEGWSVLEIGISYTAPEQPPTEIWIDDVTLATTPLGCE
jgi:hypothetical protein